MGIHLDWDVENDSGSEAVAEDAAELKARARRQMINRRALLITLLVIAIAAGIAYWRASLVREAREDTLRAVVESETLALRIGDKDKFMLIQGAEDDWRDDQREAFDLFQRARSAITVTSTILDMEIRGDEARVSVEVQINETTDQAVWLYEYTDKGWRHVATESEPWGRVDDEGEWFTISYFPADVELAHRVKGTVEKWWRQSLAATKYEGDLPPLTIVLDPDARVHEWQDDKTQLVVPVQYDESGEYPMGYVNYTPLVDLLSYYWVYMLFGEGVYENHFWLQLEAVNWFAHLWVPDRDPAMVFEELTNAFGSDLLPDYFRLMQHNRDEPILALRKAMEENASQNLQGEALIDYLTAMLRAELEMQGVYPSVDERWETDIGALFMERWQEGDTYDEWLSLAQFGGTGWVKVISTEQVNDLLWARVQFLGTYLEIGKYELMIPFRLENGYWIHAWTRPIDAGNVYTVQGGSILIEFDEMTNEMALAILPEAERAYEETANALGVENHPEVTLFVRYRSMRTYTGTTDPYQITIFPHYVSCCLLPQQDPIEQAVDSAVQNIIWVTYSQIFPDDFQPTFLINTIDNAIIDLLAQRAGAPTTFSEPIQVVQNASLPDSVDDLWTVDIGWYDDKSHFESYAAHLGAKLLLEVLMERFGEQQTILKLAQTRAEAVDLESWLQAAFGIDDGEINVQWHQRFLEEMEALGVSTN